MGWLHEFLAAIQGTLRDVLPIALIIVGFQVLVLRRRIPNLARVLRGFLYVVVGMTLFLLGLQHALFPLGKLMATQLTDPRFIYGSIENIPAILRWQDYKWIYLFAAAIGFSTTLAEPALIAVATKANQASGGAINTWALRVRHLPTCHFPWRGSSPTRSFYTQSTNLAPSHRVVTQESRQYRRRSVRVRSRLSVRRSASRSLNTIGGLIFRTLRNTPSTLMRTPRSFILSAT